jgi:uncharacterized membrane protein YjdF
VTSLRSREPSPVQVLLGVVNIFAFLAAIALASEPYASALRLNYAVIFVLMLVTLLFSQYMLAIIAAGFAMIAFRSIIGAFSNPRHLLAFLLIGISSALIAWALFKVSAGRYD